MKCDGVGIFCEALNEFDRVERQSDIAASRHKR